jgi:hypothetical protein
MERACSTNGEKRNAYKILVESVERRRTIQRRKGKVK